MNKVIIFTSVILLFFVSCAVNVRTANVPTFSYSENDFNFDSPRDFSLKLKPYPGDASKWSLDAAPIIVNAEVPLGADLQTILEVIFPDGDAFKYGKVVFQKNQNTIPLPPSPWILKDETEITLRALRVGEHK